ncbi:MAG: ATP-binding protein, partial [Ilumatobacteraceae bacterium]
MTITDMNASALAREQRTFEPVPSSAREARQFVSDTLRRHSASSDAISDFALVVSELATNFIEHGDGSRLVIFVDVSDPACWEVEVVGSAARMPRQVMQPSLWAVAASGEASGRGLGIVRHLMDDISTSIAGDQVSIRCRRHR